MKLCFGDEISDVGGSGVGNGGLLYSQDVSEEASTRGLVDGTSVLSGDITRVILQMDEEALLVVGRRPRRGRLGAGELSVSVEDVLAHDGSIPASGDMAVEKALGHFNVVLVEGILAAVGLEEAKDDAPHHSRRMGGGGWNVLI